MENRLSAFKRNGKPLVKAETVSCKVAPTITRIHDKRTLRAIDHNEESRLRHMAKIVLRAFQYKFLAIRSKDIRRRHTVRLRGVPTVQIGGTEIIHAIVFEHGIPFTTAHAALMDIHCFGRLHFQKIGIPELGYIQISSTFHIGADDVSFSIIILKNSLVTCSAIHQETQIRLNASEFKRTCRRIAGGKIFAKFPTGASSLTSQHVFFGILVISNTNATKPPRSSLIRF